MTNFDVKHLSWDGTKGAACLRTLPWQLTAKPDLGFEYTRIGYSQGGGWVAVEPDPEDGDPTMPDTLLYAQIQAIEAWLVENVPEGH